MLCICWLLFNFRTKHIYSTTLPRRPMPAIAGIGDVKEEDCALHAELEPAPAPVATAMLIWYSILLEQHSMRAPCNTAQLSAPRIWVRQVLYCLCIFATLNRWWRLLNVGEIVHCSTSWCGCGCRHMNCSRRSG